MSVFALGLNHQTAPVDLRGRFAFPLEQLSPALRALVGQFGRPEAGGLVVGAPEVALLSTCNRTELYVAAPGRNVTSGNNLLKTPRKWQIIFCSFIEYS